MARPKNKIIQELYKGLTRKEFIFCNEYIKNGGNGTKACLVAYDCKDYDSARSLASDCLAKDHIQEYIINELSQNSEALDAYIMREYTKDIASKDRNLRINALNQTAKIRGMIKNTNINIDAQLREQNEITYTAFNEVKPPVDKDMPVV
jgi:phage terminase small subunit